MPDQEPVEVVEIVKGIHGHPVGQGGRLWRIARSFVASVPGVGPVERLVLEPVEPCGVKFVVVQPDDVQTWGVVL